MADALNDSLISEIWMKFRWLNIKDMCHNVEKNKKDLHNAPTIITQQGRFALFLIIKILPIYF